jgi:hypothetical protein
MYTLFILFFASLVGIIIMVTRKLAYVRRAQILGREDVLHPFDPEIEKIKHLAKRSAKEYGHIALVATIRLYIKSANFLKQKSTETKSKIKDLINKRKNDGIDSSEIIQEDNKFLKKVSEYKQKIREIKHKITKEEEKKQ